MAGNAASVALEDGATTLKIGSHIDHTSGFDALGVDAGRESVLSLDVDPAIADGEDVSLEGARTAASSWGQTFGTGAARAWQEIVGKNLLKAKDNKLAVRLPRRRCEVRAWRARRRSARCV